MASISEPVLGVRRAMARYGWYGGGTWRGFMVWWGFFFVLIVWYHRSSARCFCYSGRGCRLFVVSKCLVPNGFDVEVFGFL